VQQDIQTVNDQNIDLTITSNVDGKVSLDTTKNDDVTHTTAEHIGNNKFHPKQLIRITSTMKAVNPEKAENVNLSSTGNIDGTVSSNTVKNDEVPNTTSQRKGKANPSPKHFTRMTSALKAVKKFKASRKISAHNRKPPSGYVDSRKLLKLSPTADYGCDARIMRNRSHSMHEAKRDMVILRTEREAVKKERKRGIVLYFRNHFIKLFQTTSRLSRKQPPAIARSKSTFLVELGVKAKRRKKMKGDEGRDTVKAEKIRAFYEEKAKCFSPIFLFNSRWLFLTSVELIILFNCVWMSLLVTNYAVMTETSPNEAQWATLLAIVFAVLVPILGLAVRKSAMIAAITELDLEAFDKVLTMTEEADELVGELSQKLNDRIEELQMDDDRSRTQIITDLFNEIDLDGSGQITKIEFSRLLHRVGISFSDAKMLNLYYAIDTDKGGSISIAEFNSVVFGISGDKSEGLELTSQIPTSAIQ